MVVEKKNSLFIQWRENATSLELVGFIYLLEYQLKVRKDKKVIKVIKVNPVG